MGGFKNRALQEYREKEDSEIRAELLNAGIPILRLPSYTNGEVKTRYVGLLNGFVFTRAWRYWVCRGDMPLAAAKEIYRLYQDLAIRAEGHAGNPEPQGYCPELQAKEQTIIEKMWEENAGMEALEAAIRTISISKDAPRFVRQYHIDTQEGLCALAFYIREKNIFASNAEPGTYAESVFPKKN